MERDVEVEVTVAEEYAALSGLLDERSRRLWAAAESRALGYGGDALVSAATGLARATIRKGRVRAWLDKRKCPTGVVVSKAEMSRLSIHQYEFHGDWNCDLHPRTPDGR